MAGSMAVALPPVETVGVGMAGGPSPLLPPADPAQAHQFARLLALPAVQSPADVGAVASWRAVADSFGPQLAGSENTLGRLRSNMLASVDMQDPIGTMFALANHSMEAQMMFAKLHISSGLASAATSLFGNLLKNQQ